MSVFLRWGIFGILAVAALVYAYNASKSMAQKHEAQRAAANSAPAAGSEPEPEPESEPETKSESGPASAPAAPHCEAELVVAQRALEARRAGEPLDRLLRIQEIAWEEPTRRQLLESLATRWYALKGDEPTPEALRISVISDCMRFSPAP
jgi:hypothetical protein